jgi:hypothetical protein
MKRIVFLFCICTFAGTLCSQSISSIRFLMIGSDGSESSVKTDPITGRIADISEIIDETIFTSAVSKVTIDCRDFTRQKKEETGLLFKEFSRIFDASDTNSMFLIPVIGPWRPCLGEDEFRLVSDLPDTLTTDYFRTFISFVSSQNGLVIFLAPDNAPFPGRELGAPRPTLEAGKYFLVLKYESGNSFNDALSGFYHAIRKMAAKKEFDLNNDGFISVSEFYTALNGALANENLTASFYQVSGSIDYKLCQLPE